MRVNKTIDNKKFTKLIRYRKSKLHKLPSPHSLWTAAVRIHHLYFVYHVRLICFRISSNKQTNKQTSQVQNCQQLCIRPLSLSLFIFYLLTSAQTIFSVRSFFHVFSFVFLYFGFIFILHFIRTKEANQTLTMKLLYHNFHCTPHIHTHLVYVHSILDTYQIFIFFVLFL